MLRLLVGNGCGKGLSTNGIASALGGIWSPTFDIQVSHSVKYSIILLLPNDRNCAFLLLPYFKILIQRFTYS